MTRKPEVVLGVVGAMMLTLGVGAATSGLSTQQARTASPSTLTGSASNSEGTSLAFARADHTHAITYTAPGAGTITRALSSRQADFVSVRDYGLVCDGVTNDSPAANAMIAALGSASVTLFVPGTCLLSTTVNFPDTMRFSFLSHGFTGSASTFTTWDPLYQDQAVTSDPMFEVIHHGSVGLGPYAFNILNWADNAAAPTAGTGAGSAFVIHQYSDLSTAFQIDNTRSQPFITLKNASNATNSVGTQGTADYFSLFGYTASSPTTNLQIGRLDQFLAFRSTDSSRPWQFISGTTAPSLQLAQGNAGPSLNILQTGAGNAIAVSQTGAATAVSITPGASADGFFPLLINGRTNGGGFSTSVDGIGRNVLQLTKNGTGLGDVLDIINKGTDKAIDVSDGTNHNWFMNGAGKITVRTGGTADTVGRAVLVAGTTTVSTTAVTASSVVQFTSCVGGGTTGVPQLGTVVAGTSFVINSVQPGTASTLQAADTSTICWQLLN